MMDNEKFVAIVLCAGFGTRLRPLTHFVGKPVVPLWDVPVAFHAIEQLFEAGFQVVHCNTHFLSSAVRQALVMACVSRGFDSRRLRFWHEDSILETGGGISRIYTQLCTEDPTYGTKDILVISGDIYGHIPLRAMAEAWRNRLPLAQALMVTRPTPTPRPDATWVVPGLVVGFGAYENLPPSVQQQNPTATVFTNYQILQGSVVLSTLSEMISSIALFYRPLLAQGLDRIISLSMSLEIPWHDIGTPTDYLACLRALKGCETFEQTPVSVRLNAVPESLKILLAAPASDAEGLSACESSPLGPNDVVIYGPYEPFARDSYIALSQQNAPEKSAQDVAFFVHRSSFQAPPFAHIPILRDSLVGLLLDEEQLKLFKAQGVRTLVFVDATVGGAGHSLALVQAFENSGWQRHFCLKLMICDQDHQALAVAQDRLVAWATDPDRTGWFSLQVYHGNFAQWAQEYQGVVHGLCADLGVSSWQLDQGMRGFSFRHSAPLDMRMDMRLPQTAWDILNTSSEQTLAQIFFDYGEEPRSRSLAKKLVECRQKGQLENDTQAFAKLVQSCLGYHTKSRVHPATRVFQALRLKVNGELDALKELLEALPQVVHPQGKAVFLTFHSLEDRMVKQAFRRFEKPSPFDAFDPLPSLGREIPRGGLVPSPEECAANGRARSARLRCFVFRSEKPARGT